MVYNIESSTAGSALQYPSLTLRGLGGLMRSLGIEGSSGFEKEAFTFSPFDIYTLFNSDCPTLVLAYELAFNRMDQRILQNALETTPRLDNEGDVQFVERVAGQFITKYKRSFDTFLEADGAIRDGAAVNDEKLAVFRQSLHDRLSHERKHYAALLEQPVENNVNGHRLHFASQQLADTGLDQMKGLAQEIYDRQRAAEILQGMNILQRQLLKADGSARANLDARAIAQTLSDYGLFTMLGQIMSDPHEVSRKRVLLSREATDMLGLPPEDARDNLQINRAIAAGQLAITPIKEDLLKILGSDEEVEKWIAFSLTCGYSAIAGAAFNEAIRGVAGERTLEKQRVDEDKVLRIIQEKFRQEPVVVFAALVHHLQNFCLLNLSGGAFKRRDGEPSPLYAELNDPQRRPEAMARLQETQLWKAVTASSSQAWAEANKAISTSEYRGESLQDALEHYKTRAVNLLTRLGIASSEDEARAEIARQLHTNDPANATMSDILMLQDWLERQVRGVSAQALKTHITDHSDEHARLYQEDISARIHEIDGKLRLLGTAEQPGAWGRSQIFQEFQAQLEGVLSTAVQEQERYIDAYLTANFSADDEDRIRRALLKARDMYYGHKMSAVGFPENWDYVHHFIVHAMIREGVGDLYQQVQQDIGKILVEAMATRATSPSEIFREIVRTTYVEAYTALWEANRARLVREDTPEFDAYATAIDMILRAGSYSREKQAAIATEFARAREHFHEAKLENPDNARVEEFVWQAVCEASPELDQARLEADFIIVQQKAALVSQRGPRPRTAYRNLPEPGKLLENIHREGGGINAIEVVFHRLPPEVVAELDAGVKPAIEQKSMELLGVLFSTDSAAGLPGVGGHRHRSRDYLLELDPAVVAQDAFLGFDVPGAKGDGSTKRVSALSRWQPNPSGEGRDVAVVYGCSASDGNLNDSTAYALLASMQATPELLGLFCPEKADIIRLGVQAAPNYNAAINPLNDRILARSGHMLRLIDGQANPLHNRYELRLPGAMANAYDVETGLTIFDLLANANQYADFLYAHDKGQANQASKTEIVDALRDLKAEASESALLRPYVEKAKGKGYGFTAALHEAKVELFSKLATALGDDKDALRRVRSTDDLLNIISAVSDQLPFELRNGLNRDYGNDSLTLVLDLMVKFHNHDMAVIALLDAPGKTQERQAALLADLVDAGYVTPGDYAARLRGEGEYQSLIRRENGELRELLYDGVVANPGKMALPKPLADSYEAEQVHQEVEATLNRSKESGLMHIFTSHVLNQAKDEGRQLMEARGMAA